MKIKKHCLYMGQEGNIRLCLAPGMDNVDAHCSGYSKCPDYREGNREIKELKNNEKR